jgi:hypothetical protein
MNHAIDRPLISVHHLTRDGDISNHPLPGRGGTMQPDGLYGSGSGTAHLAV